MHDSENFWCKETVCHLAESITVVFSNLNYTFENTCIYGLVGRNGAGKTTLLNILSNYDKNYTGVISIDGEKMNKVDNLDMPVAYAMDQPSFLMS